MQTTYRYVPLLLGAAALVAACDGGSPSGGADSGVPDAGTIIACSNREAIRPTCQALPDRFDASATVAAGCYVASTTPILGAGITLTLAPGVTIFFAEGTALEVSEGQTLVAAGTPEAPICLTGETAARGAWTGVRLDLTRGENRLEHVTIEYGGSTASDTTGAGLKATADSRGVRLSVIRSTVRESQGYGLHLGGSADVAAFEANAFTANTLGPVWVDSAVAGRLDAASAYVGNTVDEIFVHANVVRDDATWPAVGVPFHLDADLYVEAFLTIAAPSTVILPAGGEINVSGDAAGLRAVGTAEHPIRFTAEQPVRGYSGGLRFDLSNNDFNRLEHVVVEYGGSTEHDAANAAVKVTADSRGSTLALVSTTIQESEGYGLYLTGSAVLPEFAGNTFTANGLGPVNVGAAAVPQLDVTSAYTGNDLDRVRVRDGYVVGSVTWNALGVPYQIESNLHVDEVWTLAPGVTLMMSQSTWISVAGDTAMLLAVGTAEAPITFTGVEATPGYWHCVVFDNTRGNESQIAHAVVEYGGSLEGGGETAMLQAQSDSRGVYLSVTDSIIQHSGQYGIFVGHWATVIDEGNTFLDNASGDVYHQP